MSAVGLIAEGQAGDDPERVREGMSGNLCRCGAYPNIVAAVQQGNRRSWRALEKAGFSRTWAGQLESDDPSDAGPSYVYVRAR